MICYVFSFLFPFLVFLLGCLLLAGGGRPSPVPPLRGALCALLSLGGCLLPVQGIPLGRWLLGYVPQVSLPLLLLLLQAVLRALTGRRLLGTGALRLLFVWGGAGALFLYPMALGLGPWDPYALGWGRSWLFYGLLCLGAALVAMHHPLGLVFTAALLGQGLGLFESLNLWDSVMDPVFGILSLAALLRHGVSFPRKAFGKHFPRGDKEANTP